MSPNRQIAAIALALTGAATPGQDPAEQALESLRAGNQRFAAGQRTEYPRDEAHRRSLSLARRPQAVVVTCSDSSVPPELLFDAGLGDLCTLRVAGNVCTAELLAGVELAVERLGVRLCVVLAHEGCTAVGHCAARLAPSARPRPSDPAYQKLLDRIEPGLRAAAETGATGPELLARAEEENVQQTLLEMLRRSPLLRTRAKSGHLRLRAARYHQDTGLVEWLPERPFTEPASGESPTGAREAGVPTGAPPHMALRMLQAGYRRFVSAGSLAGDVSPMRRISLQHGLRPFAVVITCSDSRVVPELLFDAGIGDLHVLRIPGSVWTPAVLASVEQAVRDTGASLCVVLAHRGCDELAAAIDPDPEHERSESLRRLAERLEPAHERARVRSGGDLTDRTAVESARRTVRRLLEESRPLRELQEEGRFEITVALYDPVTGTLEWLETGRPAEPPAAPGPESGRGGPEPSPSEPGRQVPEPPQPRPPAPDPERTDGSTAEPSAAETGVGSRRIANHDLTMLVTLVGMLTVLGAGLLIWQRQSA